jgi:hypothetical protein
VKQKADGTLDKFKAWLVAQGFEQKDGIDYSDTFSLVFKSSTIKGILALDVHFQWPTRQLDVSNAFLHGTLDEEVFMEQPQGFIDSRFPEQVYRLHKSIYGLNQAPRAWFNKLASNLSSLRFTESKVDYSLSIFHDSNVHIYLLVYVDDIIVTRNHLHVITNLITRLKQSFAMKDLGPFLGIHVQHLPHGLHSSQSKYIFDVLDRAKMTSAKPTKTPLSASSKLSQHVMEILLKMLSNIDIWLVPYNIALWPGLIFPFRWINYANSRTLQQLHNGLEPNGYFDISRDPSIVVSTSEGDPFTWMPTVTPIGPAIKMTSDPQWVMLSFLVHAWLAGVPRNNL